MNSSIPLQYWDTSVFIAFLKKDRLDRVEEIRVLIRAAKDKKIRILASEFVRAEIVPTESNNLEQLRILDDFLLAARSDVQFVNVFRPIAEKARHLVANHRADKLTVPDAIHLATAIHFNVDVFFTYDGDGLKDRLRNRSGGLLKFDGCLGRPPLKIAVPCADWGDLFAGRKPPS